MSTFKLTNFFLKLYCTFFYIGCIKFAPGTFGTLISIPLYFIFLYDLPFITSFFILITFTIISSFIIGISYSKKIFDNIDHKSIIIDEILAFLFILLFFSTNIYQIIFSFLVFRFFDIYKPYPINIIDKNIKNGFGVMLDDLVAAFYCFIVIDIFYLSKGSYVW
tara:strand:- start:1875 stop:2366 length:492 start_codon:yes stop_codon:yes gene_type:complete